MTVNYRITGDILPLFIKISPAVCLVTTCVMQQVMQVMKYPQQEYVFLSIRHREFRKVIGVGA